MSIETLEPRIRIGAKFVRSCIDTPHMEGFLIQRPLRNASYMVSKGVTSRVPHGRCVLNCQEDGTRALFLAKQPTASTWFSISAVVKRKTSPFLNIL